MDGSALEAEVKPVGITLSLVIGKNACTIRAARLSEWCDHPPFPHLLAVSLATALHRPVVGACSSGSVALFRSEPIRVDVDHALFLRNFARHRPM